MKYILAIFSFLAIGMPTWAVNMAVLDAQQVVNRSEVMQEANAQQVKRVEDAQKKIDEMEAPLLKKKRELDNNKSVMSEDAFLEKQSELRSEVMKFRAEAQSIQEELDRKVFSVRKRITEAMRDIVNKMAEEQDYDVVLPKTMLFYNSEAVDITSKVLQRVNAQVE